MPAIPVGGNNNVEIERRFLVNDRLFSEAFDDLKSSVSVITQGYLSQNPESTVRVRIVNLRQAYLTIKGKVVGGQCEEFEYVIRAEDGLRILEMCGARQLTKTRFTLLHDGNTWYVDAFRGALDPLCIAEIELKTPDQKFTLPDWVTTEITHDPAYRNSVLVTNGIPKTT
jgi:CYTH domain-containing protein